MAVQVQPQHTPISASDLYSVLASIWPSVVGGAMPRLAGAMLVAQSAMETGAWADCWNWNFGNLAGTGGAEYVMLHASDGNYRPYRAYESAEDGARDWLSLMRKEPGAIAAATAGDVDGFVQGLLAGKYFEALPGQTMAETVATYAQAVGSRYNKYLPTLGSAGSPSGQSPAPAPSQVPAVVLAAGTVAAGVAVWKGVTWLAERARPRRYA